MGMHNTLPTWVSATLEPPWSCAAEHKPVVPLVCGMRCAAAKVHLDSPRVTHRPPGIAHGSDPIETGVAKPDKVVLVRPFLQLPSHQQRCVWPAQESLC